MGFLELLAIIVFLILVVFLKLSVRKGAEEAGEAVDYMTFGRYPQTAEGEVQPVEWRVLARENNKALVISRYVLDARRFDPESNDWSESEIRRWLNGEFYNSTFSDEEKVRIISFNQDNVFLLSREEAEKYFAYEVARRCKPTDYAKAKGALEIDDFSYSWWLRSPNNSNGVYSVEDDGDICINCGDVYDDDGSVRPALWINLDGSEKSGLQNELNRLRGELKEFKIGTSFSEIRKSSGSDPFKNVNVGDYMKFGRYPQTAEGEVQPVEWQVLARENNKALVISRYVLDARRFDPESNDWSESEIRRWLNGEFYNSTFSGEEKVRIISFFSGEENAHIISFNEDNVFLLSREEAEKYFADDDVRKCKPTSYAKAKGALEIDDFSYSWWLRSPIPDLSDCVYNVCDDGDVDHLDFVSDDSGSVRPALWINLES